MPRLKHLTPLIGLLCLLGLWAALAHSPLVKPSLVPGPVTTGRALVLVLHDEKALGAVGDTFLRTILAFSLAAIIGVSGGLLLGVIPALRSALAFPVHFLRSIPATALIPLFIVLVGASARGALALAASGSVLIVLAYTVLGVANVSPSRIAYARTVGASQLQMLRTVMFYEALPSIVTGLRVSISLSLILTIVAEMVMGGDGLGNLISEYRLGAEYPSMYAAVTITGILGFALNQFGELVDRSLVHWAG